MTLKHSGSVDVNVKLFSTVIKNFLSQKNNASDVSETFALSTENVCSLSDDL